MSELAAGSGDRIGEIYAAHAWGRLRMARGEYAEARRTLSAGLAAAREANDRLMQVRILIDLAELALEHDGRHRVGLDLAEIAVAESRSLGHPLLNARALDRLGRLREAAGDHAAAEAAWREAHQVFARVGSPDR